MSLALQIVFWTGLLVLFYTFLGYPIHIRWLADRRISPSERGGCEGPPMVTVVLVAYNEEERIIPRLRNLLASDYPPERLEIVVVLDGPDDGTEARIRESEISSRISLRVNRMRRGKPACLNEGVGTAAGDIIVFADARQRFEPSTVRCLVHPFSSVLVGAVSGELLIENATSGVGKSIDSYWRLEKMIRRAESCVDSCIGCTGAVYAIRRNLFEDIPHDTLLDDVVIPMRIAVSGRRVLFEASAKAFDPQALEPIREATRKRRTLAGNFQMLLRYPEWLLPWKNRLWWQLISHKYLRIMAPFVLMALFMSNLVLACDAVLYAVLLGGQISLYGLGIIGLYVPHLSHRVFAWPAGFLFLNYSTLRGLAFLVMRNGKVGW